MQKKTAKIEVRIEANLKEFLVQYAKDNNTTISALLRDYIKEIIDKWESEST